jgi:ferric iron reductase protein FhuF
MYSNIPTTQLISITAQVCDQHSLPQNIKHELISLSDTVIAQNYFCYQDKTYVQTEGLAKGAPTSSLFSEIYLQHLKTTQIVNILLQHHIVGYFQYVNDILIVS